MEFIETSVFTRHVFVLLTEDEYSGLQSMLCENPACGDVIRGGGGIRKVRYTAQSKGKSGGVRAFITGLRKRDRYTFLSSTRSRVKTP